MFAMTLFQVGSVVCSVEQNARLIASFTKNQVVFRRSAEWLNQLPAGWLGYQGNSAGQELNTR
jgi:hypothetical protein